MGHNTKQASASHIPVIDLTKIGMMAAVTCILGPLSIPIGPVPISLTNFAIYLSLYVNGMKKGVFSYLIYMLLGLAGLPVFSNFQGGPQKLFGPTGGYIFGFIFMAILAGIVIDKFENNYVLQFLALVIGTAVCYLFGTIWFIQMMDGFSLTDSASILRAMGLCVFPFIPGDLIKIVLSMTIGIQIRKRLRIANMI